MCLSFLIYKTNTSLDDCHNVLLGVDYLLEDNSRGQGILESQSSGKGTVICKDKKYKEYKKLMNIFKDWKKCIEPQWQYIWILCAHLLSSPTSFPISLSLTPQQLFHFNTELFPFQVMTTWPCFYFNLVCFGSFQHLFSYPFLNQKTCRIMVFADFKSDLVFSQGQNHTLEKTYLGSSW